MAIQFQCECGKTHSAEESMAGQAFTCNACGRALTVPSSAVARGASAFAEASADKSEDFAGLARDDVFLYPSAFSL